MHELPTPDPTRERRFDCGCRIEIADGKVSISTCSDLHAKLFAYEFGQDNHCEVRSEDPVVGLIGRHARLIRRVMR